MSPRVSMPATTMPVSWESGVPLTAGSTATIVASSWGASDARLRVIHNRYRFLSVFKRDCELALLSLAELRPQRGRRAKG